MTKASINKSQSRVTRNFPKKQRTFFKFKQIKLILGKKYINLAFLGQKIDIENYRGESSEKEEGLGDLSPPLDEKFLKLMGF